MSDPTHITYWIDATAGHLEIRYMPDERRWRLFLENKPMHYSATSPEAVATGAWAGTSDSELEIEKNLEGISAHLKDWHQSVD
jgi:hypothetical protein